MGAADLCPRVPGYRPRGGCQGRRAGNVSPGVSGASRIQGQAKFSSWLYRIALNLCRDWIRRKRRSPLVELPEGVDPVELAAETGPVESIEELASRKEPARRWPKQWVYSPRNSARPSSSRKYYGMTFQEIADLQGCPLSTVKTRLYQGLAVLRRNLERSGRLAPRDRAAVWRRRW